MVTKIPNQKSKYALLNGRLNRYVLLIQEIYEQLNLEAAKMAVGVGYDGSSGFTFSDYPALRTPLQKLQSRFVSDLSAVVMRGTSDEWKESNLIQDLLADKVLKSYGAKVDGQKYKIYYQTNSDALKAFQERKDKGMNLSDKLWNQATNYKEELEYAISSAIQKGTSAVTLSKRLSKYLQDFPTLQKDYKEKYGKAVRCNDCEYRSIRLARSEINMAYRTAEQKRWEQMDFVVGYEIKLSHAHHNRMPHGDICDELAGKYPKDFKWTGWHPNDMCYVIPILKTEEEFWADEDVISKNEVTDTPKQFNDWVSANKERIKKAKSRGTLPYFVKDNQGYLNKKESTKKQNKYDEDTGVNMLKENIIVTDKISAKGIAEYDRDKDKILMRPSDYEKLQSAIQKLNNGESLTDYEASVVRYYSHERQHQLDKKAVGGGIGQQDIQRILEANNEIRSWKIASKILGKEIRPIDIASHDVYKKEVGMLIQVGEVLGVDRNKFINALQTNSEGGIIGAYKALSIASDGVISEDLSSKILNAVFISDENYRYYKSKGEDVYNRKTIVALLNKLKIGKKGKKIHQVHFTPIDFVKSKKVSLTIQELKTYREYFDL